MDPYQRGATKRGVDYDGKAVLLNKFIQTFYIGFGRNLEVKPP